jgi:elongation factor P hydroxylase
MDYYRSVRYSSFLKGVAKIVHRDKHFCVPGRHRNYLVDSYWVCLHSHRSDEQCIWVVFTV